MKGEFPADPVAGPDVDFRYQMPARPPPIPGSTLSPPPTHVGVGVDLGITSAYVAVCTRRPTLVADQHGHSAIPMVVARADNRLLVGPLARQQMLANPGSSVFGLLRLLGRRFVAAETAALAERLPYQLCPDDEGRLAVRIGTTRVSLETTVGLLLGKLRAMAQLYLGEPVDAMVVAIPSRLEEERQEALRHAAAAAGLDVHLITAPAAALQAVMPPPAAPQLVLHLGGGSCEVAVLDSGGTPLALVGDDFLGGDLLDEALAELLLAEPAARAHPELAQDPVCRQRLRDAAEQAKRQLGDEGAVTIDLPYLLMAGDEPVHLRLALDRQRLAELARPLLEAVLALCAGCLDQAGVDPQQLGRLVLVGGQARLAALHACLAERFEGVPVVCDDAPEETAALGAAVVATHL